jgi:hypothetical protein
MAELLKYPVVFKTQFSALVGIAAIIRASFILYTSSTLKINIEVIIITPGF